MAKIGDEIRLMVGSVYTVKIPAILDDPEQIIKGKFEFTAMTKDAFGPIAVRAAEGTSIRYRLGDEYPTSSAIISNEDGDWEVSIYWILDSGYGDLEPFDPFGKTPAELKSA